MKNWKTTLGGIVSGLMLAGIEALDGFGVGLAGDLGGMQDGHFDMQIFIAGMALVWSGWMARDHDVTSEEAGADVSAKIRREDRAAKLKVPILLMACLLFVGCQELPVANTAESDRGAWGDVREHTTIQKGIFFGSEWQFATSQDLNTQTTTPVQVIANEIARLEAQLVEAEAAEEPDPDAIVSLKAQISSLIEAKATAKMANAPGSIIYIDTGDITTTAAGDQDSDSSGAATTSQTGTPSTTGHTIDVPISVTP